MNFAYMFIGSTTYAVDTKLHAKKSADSVNDNAHSFCKLCKPFFLHYILTLSIKNKKNANSEIVEFTKKITSN